jgi:hypothetical protein
VVRVVSTAIVLALLAATAAAFALTERAKLTLSPIYGTRVDQTFSPDGTSKPVAHVRFRVRPAERVDVWIQDSHGHKWSDLVTNRSVKAHQTLSLVWDSLNASGIAAPDGTYHPVVKLLRSHRVIGLPSKIVLDTKPPVITVKHPQYPIISPDGDGHADVFRIPYRLSEPGNAILLLRGVQVGFTRCCKQSGVLTFNGKVKVKGKLVKLPPGRYVLGVAAQDVAGNRSKGYPFAIVQIRYVVLARTRVVVKSGGKFALRVSTDAPTVHWTLHGRSGTEPRGTLHFRAPKRAGVYKLYISVGSHSAVCSVVVA